MPEGYYTLPLGKARVLREGKAATLIGYGGMVEVMLEAAEVAQREGVEVTVVDLETLVPLDEETLLGPCGRRAGPSWSTRPCAPGASGRRSRPASPKGP